MSVRLSSQEKFLAEWESDRSNQLTDLSGSVAGIGCFVCTSLAGSDVECEDNFSNLNSVAYQEPCMSGLKGRAGVYPASSCLKISGYYGKRGHCANITLTV